jgi:hypothetical protein
VPYLSRFLVRDTLSSCIVDRSLYLKIIGYNFKIEFGFLFLTIEVADVIYFRVPSTSLHRVIQLE